jgi:hypothetical protein
MRSFIALFWIFVLSWSLPGTMAQQVVFEKKFTDPPCFDHYSTHGKQVCELNDGSIIVLGRANITDTCTNPDPTGWTFDLKKLDAGGNIIWEYYSLPNPNFNMLDISSFLTLENGNILLVGKKEEFMFSPELVFLLLVNADGQYLFDTTYTTGYLNYIYTIPWSSAMTTDGFVIAGYTFVPYGQHEAYLLKLDSGYHKQWEFKLDPSYGLYGEFRKVITTPDGNIDCFGLIQKPPSDRDLFLFVRLNAAGQMILFKTYEYSGSDARLYDALASPGLRMMMGFCYNDQSRRRFILMKTDENGNFLWQKIFSDSADVAYLPGAITLNNEYQVLITGQVEYPDYVHQTWGASDIYLLKTDPDGNKLWEETYGTNYTYDSTFFASWETCDDIIQASDGSYLLCGMNNITTEYGPVMNLIKVTEGFAGNQNQSFPSCNAVLSPNPVHEYTMLKLFSCTPVNDGQLMLFDLTGKIVKQFSGLNGTEFSLTRDGLPDGIYFYSLKDHMTIIARGKAIVN